MKRTVGALALLVGIGGCSSFHGIPVGTSQSVAADALPGPTEKARGLPPTSPYAGSLAPEPMDWPQMQRAPIQQSVSARPETPPAPYQPLPSGATPPPALAQKTAAPPSRQPMEDSLPSPPAPPPWMTAVWLASCRPLPPSSGLGPDALPASSLQVAKKSEASVFPSESADVPQGKSGQTARHFGVTVRVVNSQRFTLDFSGKDVGPGFGPLELWYTRDGTVWKLHATVTRMPPYAIDVPEDGRYGFILRRHSQVGPGHERPGAGDEPQRWVIVDQTKPEVQLLDVAPTRSDRLHALAIHWKAADDSFGKQPISLFYAESAAGPWQPIAANVPNTGRYTWQLPPKLPGRFFIRVEAVDLAGNIGKAQTAAPIILDSSKPTVSILAVEAGGR